MIWPSHLAIFYPSTPELFPWWQIAGAFLFLVGISLLVIRFVKQRPYLGVDWLWYLGTLLPVIGLVQVGSQSMADRYTYIPLIGLFIMIAWGIADFLKKQPHARTIMLIIGGGVISVFMAMAWLQVQHWQNSITLFGHALQVTRYNALAHTNLGLALSHQGRRDEAMTHYSAALRLSPNNATILSNMGVAIKRDKALAEIRESLRAAPDNPVLYYKLGELYKKSGELDKAIVQYEKALSIRPEFVEAINALAIAHAVKGDYDHAISFFKRLLTLQPENSDVPYSLAGIYAMQHQPEKSVGWLKQAVEKGYDNWNMLKNDPNLENIRGTSYYKELIRGK